MKRFSLKIEISNCLCFVYRQLLFSSHQKVLKLLVLFILSQSIVFGQLDTNWIYSKHLDDNIQYFTYLIGDSDVAIQRTVYVLDGKKMIDNGILETLDNITHTVAVKYIFVSSMVEENGETKDKREEYFTCNPSYLTFFEKELIPNVKDENTFIKNRMLLGASFGGMCAAYFAAESKAFTHYALLSPITYLCKDLNTHIAFSENRELNIYASTGQNDAEVYLAPLINSFRAQQHKIFEVKTEGGHDFENWKGQLKKIVDFFEVV